MWVFKEIGIWGRVWRLAFACSMVVAAYQWVAANAEVFAGPLSWNSVWRFAVVALCIGGGFTNLGQAFRGVDTPIYSRAPKSPE
jgi:hypothetical protein